MPGGNKNIKPSDGKQFSSEYQPAEKWTEKKALALGNELITWLTAEEENMFFEEFLYLNNDYYLGLPSYLAEKFSSFSKLLEKAKKIQEIKLVKYGCFDKLNATMTKFTLINNHNYSSESKEPEKVVDNNITFKFGGTAGDELTVENLANDDS